MSEFIKVTGKILNKEEILYVSEIEGYSWNAGDQQIGDTTYSFTVAFKNKETLSFNNKVREEENKRGTESVWEEFKENLDV